MIDLYTECQQFIDKQMSKLSTPTISTLGLSNPTNLALMRTLWVNMFISSKLHELETLRNNDPNNKSFTQVCNEEEIAILVMRLNNCPSFVDVIDEFIHFITFDMKGRPLILTEYDMRELRVKALTFKKEK